VTLAEGRTTAVRKLYFVEATNESNGPTRFFLTVEGQTPKVFDSCGPPAVVTKAGARLEDWIITNHSGRGPNIDMHRIQFLFRQVNGKNLPNPELGDTVTVPAWDGIGPHPLVKLRMDFPRP
jgi:hypothetical protein